MEINTDSQVDRLIDMGLDGYTDEDSVQKGGQSQGTSSNVPVFIMDIGVLKILNLFNSSNPQTLDSLKGLKGYYCFCIGHKKVSKHSSSFLVYLLTTKNPQADFVFEDFTKVAELVMNTNVDISLSDLLETIFQYVNSGTTDALMNLFRLKPEENVVSIFSQESTQTFQQTEIEEFSKSLSTIHTVLDKDTRPLLQPISKDSQPSQDSWLVSNIKARLGNLTTEIQTELQNENWRAITNTGGGDCFFLSLCQSRVLIQDTTTQTSIHTYRNGTMDTCVSDIREFIAKNITEDQFNARKGVSSDIGHALPAHITSLKEFKDYVKTSSYYADEMTIGILQEKTNLYPIIINRDLTYSSNKPVDKPVIKCYLNKVTRENLTTFPFVNKQFVLLIHIEGGGGHYELIQYKSPSGQSGQETEWKSVFETFDTLPKSIQELFKKDCVQGSQTQGTQS